MRCSCTNVCCEVHHATGAVDLMMGSSKCRNRKGLLRVRKREYSFPAAISKGTAPILNLRRERLVCPPCLLAYIDWVRVGMPECC